MSLPSEPRSSTHRLPWTARDSITPTPGAPVPGSKPCEHHISSRPGQAVVATVRLPGHLEPSHRSPTFLDEATFLAPPRPCRCYSECRLHTPSFTAECGVARVGQAPQPGHSNVILVPAPWASRPFQGTLPTSAVLAH
jgi:hypothetical protein